MVGAEVGSIGLYKLILLLLELRAEFRPLRNEGDGCEVGVFEVDPAAGGDGPSSSLKVRLRGAGTVGCIAKVAWLRLKGLSGLG